MRLRFGSGVVFGIAAALFGALGCGSNFSVSGGGDAGADDGGGTVEGGSADASVAFCANAGSHFFCDDFDSHASGDVKGTWDAVLSTGNASLAIDATTPKSPPGDLLAQLTHAGDTDGDQAALAKKVGRVRSLTVEYDTLVDSYGNPPNEQPSSLAVPLLFTLTSGVTMALGLATPDNATFYESSQGSQAVAHPLSTGIPVGQWTHVLVRIQPPSPIVVKGNVHIEINGKLALDSELSLAQNLVTSDSNLAVGLLFPQSGNAQSQWSIHFDNVVIDP